MRIGNESTEEIAQKMVCRKYGFTVKWRKLMSSVEALCLSTLYKKYFRCYWPKKSKSDSLWMEIREKMFHFFIFPLQKKKRELRTVKTWMKNVLRIKLITIIKLENTKNEQLHELKTYTTGLLESFPPGALKYRLTFCENFHQEKFIPNPKPSPSPVFKSLK